MEEYCENCGAELKRKTNFCPKCGHNISKESKICPNCKNNIDYDAEFCSKCGFDLNPAKPEKKEKFTDKYRIPLVIIAIIILAVGAFTLTPGIQNILDGTQVVDVNGYDFTIPASFEFDEEASAEELDEKIEHKEWTNGDKHIEIAVISYDSDTDIYKILEDLGGESERKYDIPGRHYHFKNGEESFSFNTGDDMISIIVNDPSLYDRIGVVL